jgi:SAM-dependent methyltransferase
MNLSHNEKAWDRMARAGHRFARPTSDREFQDALQQIACDPWLEGSLAGRQVLCLAAGGGRHGPIYAAAGAVVTVVDLSPEQLAIDRQVAAERKLDLRTVQSSMDDLTMLRHNQFDLVVHPVSTCYVPRVQPVFNQVARVTRPGGLYISQHKQPINLQAQLRPSGDGYRIVRPYYNSAPVAESDPSGLLREMGTREYLHRWEELLGGMCQAGFVVEGLYEPRHGQANAEIGSFAHRGYFVPPYVRIKARRREAIHP